MIEGRRGGHVPNGVSDLEGVGVSGSDDGSSALDVAGTPGQRNRVDTDLTRVGCNIKNKSLSVRVSE